MALGRTVNLPRFGLMRRKPNVIARADRARDAGQWELAAGLYRKALDRDPLNSGVWVQYGHALKESGDLRDPDKLAQADAAYRRALSLDPCVADPHLHLGHVLKLQGKTKEAEASYLRAFALDPSMPYPLQELSGLGWSKAMLDELQGLVVDQPLRGSSPGVGGDGQAPTPVPADRDAQCGAKQKWSSCFDAEWYLEHNPDVAHAGVDPLEHFLTYGSKEGRKPNGSAANSAEHSQDYAEWIRLYDTIDDDDRRAIARAIAEMNDPPLISVVMPVYETPEVYLRAAIDSVRQQLYPQWELCIADDASTAPHVRGVLEHYCSIDARIKVCYRNENGHISAASNSALALATGSFIALLDHDDVLPEHALYMVAATLNSDPEVDLIYSDEDKIDTNGQRFGPIFKPDWNPDLMLSQNMFCHLGVYRRSLIEKIGGFRCGYEGSQDYDLVLRAQRLTTAKRIRHIPHVLYHWRAIPGSAALRSEEKPYAVERAREAIADHLAESGVTAEVLASSCPMFHRVRYALPTPTPRVTIVIPTRDRVDLLRTCVGGLLHRTDYPDLEILIVDNQSKDAASHAYFYQLSKDARVRILSYDAPFNYSAINNFAVARATGPLLCFLNNDIEVISPDWLTEMVSHAIRTGIGAVGALLYYPDDSIQHGGVVLGLEGVAGHIPDGSRRGDFGYCGRATVVQNLSAVTAACLVMPKLVFDEIGGFNERDLTVTYNDVDLCLRICEAGYRIVWTPYAELYHLESVSRGRDTDPHNVERSKAEVAYMLRRWGHILDRDPYYNPNLRLDRPAFDLAFPPRVEKPWRYGNRKEIAPATAILETGTTRATSRDLAPSRRSRDIFRLLYVSGEPEIPGHHYRIVRPMAVAAELGVETAWMRVDEIPGRLRELEAADAVIIWRAAWDEQVSMGVDAARRGGAKIVFDVDDLMFDPDLARLDVIDGIRTQGLREEAVRQYYCRVRSTMSAADLCLATTDELAAHMRNALKPTVILANGFDNSTLTASRLAARRRLAAKPDGLVRIGYAGGTRTHQRDFALCASAIGEIIREHPECRLVAFRSVDSSAAFLDVEEFPALRGLEDKIEWRNFVPLKQLPEEVARFDINLSPLEVGNPFCEAKSELKFFEAALAGVPTIASPTGPFRRAIRHGETGFLAATPSEWCHALKRLVTDPILRRRVSAAARRDVLWSYGPERTAEAMASLLDLLKGGRDAARAFEIEAVRGRTQPSTPPRVPEHEVVFAVDHLRTALVTVAVPLYNYAQYIGEALDSVATQTLQELDLVVIDDCSTDDSLAVALGWARANINRFNRISILRNHANSGLGLTRNVGFDAAETKFVLPLDADNRLLPDCAVACLKAAQSSGAAFAYPLIKTFGAVEELRRGQFLGGADWDPMRLVFGNYIDAMALISKAVWAAVGGYDHVRTGWEDFDLWCKLAERGLRGERVPGGPLAEYRVHRASMLESANGRPETVSWMMDHLKGRHPWLKLNWALPNSSHEAADPACSAQVGDVTGRLTRILPILRCPETGGRLTLTSDRDALVSEDGSRRWQLMHGRPLLFPGGGAPKVNSDTHLSNPLPDSAMALIRETRGLVLHLSAGGTEERYDNVVEAEAAIFRHTDLVADVHHLPFVDCSFEAVIALNAFEHYRDPWQAAREIYRILRPGGRVLIHTAFLQPLHEAPWHFYNCTRHGLEVWFEAFETETLHVSDNFHAGYSLSWLASECESALRGRLSDAAADAFLAAPIERVVSFWRDEEKRRGTASLWKNLSELPQDVQESVAAGFEYIGRRPA
jgi:glycosyltransferase involved in cell wall biosynthesis/SAM-dependent methyltransferase